MCTSFTCPDYYGASAPSWHLRPTTGLSRWPGRIPGSRNDTRWFPCSLRIDRPARHPALPRQHRHGYAAGLHRDLPTGTPSRLRSQPPTPDGRALHPGPYPPDLSRCHAYGALPLVPLVYRLISLAGPGPSGSTRPSRLCQRCFPPSPASPGSDCAQLLPGCCDSPARRSCTSFDSQRLTAHQRLVAHQEFRILGHLTPGQHRQAAQQTACEQVGNGEDHSAMISTPKTVQAVSDRVIEPHRLLARQRPRGSANGMPGGRNPGISASAMGLLMLPAAGLGTGGAAGALAPAPVLVPAVAGAVAAAPAPAGVPAVAPAAEEAVPARVAVPGPAAPPVLAAWVPAGWPRLRGFARRLVVRHGPGGGSAGIWETFPRFRPAHQRRHA